METITERDQMVDVVLSCPGWIDVGVGMVERTSEIGQQQHRIRMRK